MVMLLPLLFITTAIFWQLVAGNGALPSRSVLVPVSDAGWDIDGESESHSKREADIERRKTPASKLRLLGKEHFVWNSAADTDDNIFVNMTMFTGDEELIISMERFASELRAVNCSNNMMMAFNTNASYSSAINSWEWVNFNENRTFIMIANHRGCGAEKSRQPWVVSNVAYDPAHLIVYLNATKKSWKEVAHTFHLDFGKYSPTSPSNKHRRFGIDKQVSLDLSATLPVDLVGSFKGVSITCKSCGTKGTLTLAGHIEYSWFKLSAFTLSAHPKAVQLALNLNLALSGSDPAFSWKPDPVTFATIPLGGFSIPELLTLGPNLQLGAGIAIDGLKGTATLASTFKAVIPDTSVAEIRLAGKRGATFSGWVPQFSVSTPTISATVSSTAEVFGQAKVGVALELLGQGFDVSLALKLPDVVATAKPVSGITCGGKNNVASGVSLSVSIGAALGIKAATHIGGQETDFVDVPVVTIGAKSSPPFLSTCIPL